MKTKLLMTLAFLFFIPLMLENPADACQYIISDNTLQEDFDVYDFIFLGKIIRIGEGSTYVPVEIEMLESWKGQPDEKILLFPCKGESSGGLQFQEGKSYLIFAEKLSSEYPVVTDFGPTKLLSDAKNEILFLDQKSNTTRFHYDASASSLPSPLKQFKSGIAVDEVQCKEVLGLMVKHDGTPACVKFETILKLVERGWAKNGSEINHALSSYMNKIIPTLDDFKNTLSEPYSINTIFLKFGEPHRDIGSGIHIYVYELNDLTEIWIGYVNDIRYVNHVDADGSVLEELWR